MNSEKYQAAVKKIGEEVDHLFHEGVGAQELIAALFTLGVAKVRRVVKPDEVKAIIDEMVAASLKVTDLTSYN